MNHEQAMTAPLFELRNWLAEMDGWRCYPADPDPYARWKRGDEACEHPCPATLDGASGAMLEGWEWSRYPTPSQTMMWAAWKRGKPGYPVKLMATDNEIDDRIRLAALCYLAASGRWQ